MTVIKNKRHMVPANTSDNVCQFHIIMVDFSITPKRWLSPIWNHRKWFIFYKLSSHRRNKRHFLPKNAFPLGNTWKWTNRFKNKTQFQLTRSSSTATAAAARKIFKSNSMSSSVPHTVSECNWHGLNTIDWLASQTVHGMHLLSCCCHHWCSSQIASINWQ